MLAGLGGAIAVFAILQRFTDARQAHAFFANRNFAAAALAMLLPFALAWGHRARVPLVLAVFAGLAATGSRGGALAAAVVFVFWLAPRLPRFGRLAYGLVLLPLLLLPVVGDANTVKVRKHWYAAALDLGAERPVLGHGTDGFEREYPPVRPREEYAISGGRRVHAVQQRLPRGVGLRRRPPVSRRCCFSSRWRSSSESAGSRFFFAGSRSPRRRWSICRGATPDCSRSRSRRCRWRRGRCSFGAPGGRPRCSASRFCSRCRPTRSATGSRTARSARISPAAERSTARCGGSRRTKRR